ncbi:hypothetical protein HELRODRAFT_168133 [Helobdella robusta]|uniref:Uncharacterized protein n=1 Tax=Helobdella robusta TaxID=6412 RepID=T1F074_HELRO|nr:hypothetical protein HELRODRAFT_168133 [Helobdella robusta]ESO10243.1 hypothetical protein HELRODRAFT_168133 [Helobdella robusta]
MDRINLINQFNNVVTRTRGHSMKYYKEITRHRNRENYLFNRTANIWNSLPNELVDAQTLNSFKADKKTPLHLVASYFSNLSQQMDGICRIASKLLKNACHFNAQDAKKCTPLHCAVEKNNAGVFSLFIEQPTLNLDVKNCDGHTPLWLALITGSQEANKVNTQFPSNEVVSNNISHRLCYNEDYDDVYDNDSRDCDDDDDGFPENSMASQLVSHGSSVNVRDEETGNTMLHEACLNKLVNASIFLIKHGACLDSTNLDGESPLHIACRLHLLRCGYADVVHVLLQMCDLNVASTIKKENRTTPESNSNSTYLLKFEHEY